MRRNTFGDSYCHDESEVADCIENSSGGVCGVNADIEVIEEDGLWGGEVRTNESGDTVCFMEGFASKEAIVTALLRAGVTRSDINVI